MSVRATIPLIVPRPRELALRGGFLPLPARAPVHIPADADPRLVSAVEVFTREDTRFVLTRDEKDPAFIRFEPDGHFGPEGFGIEIEERSATVRAGDAAGAFHALNALRQILRQTPAALPMLVITDGPELAERGFMLDVSRTKVPTLETLFSLVDRLAELRYNRLQLYIEHTFAFPGHESVWKDASPFTTEDIRKTDAYCRERFITLVPNLNGFGHFERWLKHPEYRHMAECPEGFWHDLAHAHRDPGTLIPDTTSLEFMASLYDDYLPNFTSDTFNVGGDEPWELGQGRSKQLCETEGKQTVYLEYMKGLYRLCSARGKRMQFWADILLEHPERAGEAPADAVPVIWGYDAGHPYDAQCATLKNLGRTYLVAPGGSTWNSFSSRWENARINIGETVMYAGKHGAAGILMTAWGDNGNHWAWPVMYPSLTYAAAAAWSLPANLTLDLERAVDLVWFDDEGRSAKALMTWLGTDSVVAKSVRNKSVLWELLFNPPSRRAAALENVSAGELRDTLAHLDKVESLLPEDRGNRFRCELLSGISLSRIAARRGLAELSGEPDVSLKIDFERVIVEYEAAWLLRARTGGLAESAAHLRRVLGEL